MFNSVTTSDGCGCDRFEGGDGDGGGGGIVHGGMVPAVVDGGGRDDGAGALMKMMRKRNKRRNCRPEGPQRNARELQLPLPLRMPEGRAAPTAPDAPVARGPAGSAADDAPQTPARDGCSPRAAPVEVSPPPGEQEETHEEQSFK